MLFNYFNLKYFLISFAIGIFYIYITDDYKKVVIIYPTPDNIDKYTFVDKSNKCFNYKLKESKCKSKSIPVNIEY